MKIYSLKIILCTAVVLTGFLSNVVAQDKSRLSPLPENAPLEQTREWLINAVKKYAKYKTRTREFTVSNVKFTGCTLNYTLVSRISGSSTATMGTTVTTSKDAQEISIQHFEVATVSLVEHLYPELRVIKLDFRPADAKEPLRNTEIVVKADAGEQLKNGFEQAAGLCRVKP